MKLEDLIPGVSAVKLALAGAAVVGLLAGGIAIHNWWQNYCNNQCELNKASFEKQRAENGVLQGRLDTALDLANSNADLLKQMTALRDDAEKRAAEMQRQRDLFWRKVHDIEIAGEDGKLVDGIRDVLVQLCREIAASGGVCSATGQADSKAGLPSR